MFFHRAARMRWGHLCVLLYLTNFPACAQNSLATEFTSLNEWKGAWRQKPLRQNLPLTGRWSVTAEQLPSQSTVALPALLPGDGEFACTRDFFLDAALADKPLRFVASAINYRCQVQLNDNLVGQHEGGFTPFAFDFNPEQLLPGQNNRLRLVVDTRLQPLTTIPARLRPQAGQYTPGIFENLFIEVLPDFAIDSVRYTATIENDHVAANIRLSISLRIRENVASTLHPASIIFSGSGAEPGPAAPSRVNSTSPEPSGEKIRIVADLFDSTRTQRLAGAVPVVVERFDDMRQEFNLDFRLDKPRLWSPATPHLYSLRVAVLQGQTVIDEWWETIGLRNVQWEKNGIVVNGQPTFLRGIEWVAPGTAASPVADSAACEEIARQVRAWGGNLLRVVGQPAPPPLIDACDRHGLFLLEEIPVYHFTPAHFAQNRFFEIAAGQLSEMITRDRNHPSVLAWGMATNSLLADPHKQIFRQVREVALQLDDRPLYAVAESALAKPWLTVADFLIIDSFEKDAAADLVLLKDADKPLLSRFGFSLDASDWRASSNQATDLAAQQRQARQFKSTLDKFTPINALLSGYVIAALEDWRVDAPLLRAATHKDLSVYPAGLLSATGEPRLAFQVTQAMNREMRGPAVLPEDFAAKHPEAYAIAGIGLVAVIIFFINRDRRLRGNLRRIFAHPHGFYVDIVENRKISPFLTILIAVAEGCISAILLSGFLFAYRHSFVLDNMLTLITGGTMVKAKLIWLIWHPGWFIVAGTAAYLLFSVALASLMRIVAFLFGRRVLLPQLFTFIFWAAANILLLGVIAPFFYRLLISGKFTQPLLFGITVVAGWLLLRLFRGMKVIFTVNSFKALFLFALVFGGIGLSIYLYYDRTQALWDYAAYYWSILATR